MEGFGGYVASGLEGGIADVGLDEAVVVNIGGLVAVAFSGEGAAGECDEVAGAGTGESEVVRDFHILAEGGASCGGGEVAAAGFECEADLGGAGFLIGLGEEVWLKADDDEVAGSCFAEGLVEDVFRAGGDGEPHVDGGEAGGFLDDFWGDGEGATGAAGEKDDGCVGLFRADFYDGVLSLLDGVVPKNDLRVHCDGEYRGKSVCSQQGGEEKGGEFHVVKLILNFGWKREPLCGTLDFECKREALRGGY